MGRGALDALRVPLMVREPGRWWSRATDFQEAVASVGLIVGRQAHPFFGSKIIVSLLEPQRDKYRPTVTAAMNRHMADPRILR